MMRILYIVPHTKSIMTRCPCVGVVEFECSFGDNFVALAATTRDGGVGALPHEEALYFFTIVVWHDVEYKRTKQSDIKQHDE